MLYLVGYNIDSVKASRRCKSGQMTKLVDGVYCDSTDDLEAVARAHIVRIGRYLYRQGRLCGLSAVNQGVGSDGVLHFLGAHRLKQYEICGITLRQDSDTQLALADVRTVTFEDPLGSFSVPMSSPAQALLESIPMRAARVQSSAELQRVIIRLLAENNGDVDAAEAVVEALATRLDWATPIAGTKLARRDWAVRLIEEHVRQQSQTVVAAPLIQLGPVSAQPLYQVENASSSTPAAAPLPPQAGRAPGGATRMTVGWGRSPIGQLEHDAAGWLWRPNSNWLLPFPEATAGRLPPFITNLMPEGWLEAQVKQLHGRGGAGGVTTGHADLRSLLTGRRYMSNILIIPEGERLSDFESDFVKAPLVSFTGPDGVAPLELDGMPKAETVRALDGSVSTAVLEQARRRGQAALQQQLADLWKDVRMPRLSGAQVKVPCDLAPTGRLTPSVSGNFSHILKLPGSDCFQPVPVLEWYGLEMAQAAGLDTAVHALVQVPGFEMPSLLVERFDIPQRSSDDRLILAEDFCIAANLAPEYKETGSMEEIGALLRQRSSVPAADLENLLRRAVVTWVVGDGDCHRKNLSLLSAVHRIGGRQADGFDSVRLAPAYDIVPTRGLPGHEHGSLVLSVNGKHADLEMADWVSLGAAFGIGSRRTQDIVRNAANQVGLRSVMIFRQPPRLAMAAALEPLREAVLATLERVVPLAPQLDGLVQDLRDYHQDGTFYAVLD